MKRKYLFLLLFGSICMGVKAQFPIEEIQNAFEACLKLRAAVGSGSNEGMKQANKLLKDCHIQPFYRVKKLNVNEPTLNGHLLFDYVFVDSLIKNRKAYNFAQQYSDQSSIPNEMSIGRAFAKTFAVKGKKSSTYTLMGKGLQCIAVVTEPKGLISLRIHDITNNVWYNDTDEFYPGRPFRYRNIYLPKDKNNILEIEIINMTKKDISFVIIGN